MTDLKLIVTDQWLCDFVSYASCYCKDDSLLSSLQQQVMDVDESEAASEPLMSDEGNGVTSSTSSSNSHKETSKLIAHVHQANVT